MLEGATQPFQKEVMDLLQCVIFPSPAYFSTENSNKKVLQSYVCEKVGGVGMIKVGSINNRSISS